MSHCHCHCCYCCIEALTELHLRNLAAAEEFLMKTFENPPPPTTKSTTTTVQLHEETISNERHGFVAPTEISFDKIYNGSTIIANPVRHKSEATLSQVGSAQHPTTRQQHPRAKFADRVRQDINMMTKVGKLRVDQIAMKKKLELEQSKTLALPSPKSLKPGILYIHILYIYIYYSVARQIHCTLYYYL